MGSAPIGLDQGISDNAGVKIGDTNAAKDAGASASQNPGFDGRF
jgi:hypothetical protein